MRVHQDTRRRFVADLFPTPGDTNVVYLYAKEPIAWHRHQRQTDYLYCAAGRVRVGLVRPKTYRPSWFILDNHSDVLEIPPDHWHGYEALGGEAILVSYISQKFNPDDEQRASLTMFEWPATPST